MRDGCACNRVLNRSASSLAVSRSTRTSALQSGSPNSSACSGPPAAAKSTALRLIGDCARTGGRSGRRRDPAATWERLAYVFQSPRLAAVAHALGNVRVRLEMRDPRRKPRRSRRAARRAQCSRWSGWRRDRTNMPAMLSGGERQRVAIARALARRSRHHPDGRAVLGARSQTRACGCAARHFELWQETGKTIVFVTHDIEEALFLADRIIVLLSKSRRASSRR